MKNSCYSEPEATQGWKQRTWLLAGIVAFVAAFQFVYRMWLFPVYGYYGFEYNAVPLRYLTLAWVLSVVPGFWLPARLTRPSQFIYWVIYTTVFVPSMFVPLYMGLNRLGEVALLMTTLFAGFAVLGTSYLLRPLSLPPVKVSSSLFWTCFMLVTIGLTLWVVAVFRGHLRIVSFSEVYDLRFAAVDVAKGSLVTYATMWLSAVVGPFLLSLGALWRKPSIFAAGMLIQLLIYAEEGAKSVVVSIVVIPLLYLMLRDKGANFGPKFSWANTILLFGLSLGSLVKNSSVLNLILVLVLMRIFGNSGLMTGQYYHFFQNNPLTYYSHVKGMSWFVHYPYANPVSLELGYYYSGDPDYDANAHFWATDGIAALGLPGVLLVSVFCALLFWLLDSAANRHDLRFTVPLISFAALNLANVSVFTTVLSGGLGMLVVILYLMPTEALAKYGWRCRAVEVQAT